MLPCYHGGRGPVLGDQSSLSPQEGQEPLASGDPSPHVLPGALRTANFQGLGPLLCWRTSERLATEKKTGTEAQFLPTEKGI